MTNNPGSTSTRRDRRLEKKKQEHKQKTIRNIAIISVLAIAAVVAIYFLQQASVANVRLPDEKERPPVSGRTMGDPNAPVVMEVYEDFQCPACKQFNDTVKPQIIENFIKTGQVLLVYRHFAFLGPESRAAAEASMCATEQERFWDYHDVLFENQVGENIGSFSDRRLIAFAEQLDLDMDAFRSCIADTRYENTINDEITAGRELQVPGTPSVVVNGQLLSSFNYLTITQAVQAALGQ